jgi:hypothetical protein
VSGMCSACPVDTSPDWPAFRRASREGVHLHTFSACQTFILLFRSSSEVFSMAERRGRHLIAKWKNQPKRVCLAEGIKTSPRRSDPWEDPAESRCDYGATCTPKPGARSRREGKPSLFGTSLATARVTKDNLLDTPTQSVRVEPHGDVPVATPVPRRLLQSRAPWRRSCRGFLVGRGTLRESSGVR